MGRGSGWIMFRVAAILLAVFLAGGGLTSAARAAGKPAVAAAKIVVTMGEDGNDTVEATFTIKDAGALKDGVVEHLLMRRPGAEVGEVTASGAIQGQPTWKKASGISRLGVKVSGDPATYTLRYKVRREPGTFSVPVLAPNLPAASSQYNVAIETVLPAGQQLAGEIFPSLGGKETRGGRTVLLQRVINVPSQVIAEYGTGRRITLTDATTAAGLIVFLVILWIWYRYMIRGQEVTT